MSFMTELFLHPLMTCCARTFLSVCHIVEVFLHVMSGDVDPLLVAKAAAMLPAIRAELREWKGWLLLAIAIARAKFFP